MKKPLRITLLLLVATGAVVSLILAYLAMGRERAKEAQGERPVTAESKVVRGANGETAVNLDQKTQQLIGLKSTVLPAAVLAPEIKGYGRALDPSPLIGRLSSVASARAALEASANEYQRVKALFAQGQNASARALEAAAAAMKRDQIALTTAEAQLVSEWGKAVASQPDLPSFVQSLSTLETVLVRLDLPAGESPAETPTGARLVLPGASQPIAGWFLGRAAMIDPQVQGQGFLFVVTNTAARLSPGLALTGFLQLPGEPLHGVIVPETAVVRAVERAWVYAQTSATAFTRRDISLAHPVADGWFVSAGVFPDDRVVTTGAQTLLSEERKTEIKVGD
jgi:multidrug efflux system membrane fusion protein